MSTGYFREKLILSRRPLETWVCVIYLIGQGVALHFTTITGTGIASSFLLFDNAIHPRYAQEILASIFVLVGGMLWGADSKSVRTLAIATYGLWFCLAIVASVRFSLFTAGWTIGGLLAFMYLALIYEPEHTHG